MSAHITAIEKTATGWEYTTDINAGHVFDVYDSTGAVLLLDQTGGTFEIVTEALVPPGVAIDYYTDYLLPYKLGSIIASNRIVLQWLNMGADAYHVEQYIDDEWYSVATVSGNELYLQYATVQSGDTDTTWRVTPCKNDGVDIIRTGQPIQFDIIHVGLPETPSVVLSVDEGTITVTEAPVTPDTAFDGI